LYQHFYIRKMKVNKEGNTLNDYLKTLWKNVVSMMIHMEDADKYKEIVTLKEDIANLITTRNKVCLKESLDAVKRFIIADTRNDSKKRVFCQLSLQKYRRQFQKLDLIYKNIALLIDEKYFNKQDAEKKIKKLAEALLKDIVRLKQDIHFEWDEAITLLLTSMFEMKEISMRLLMYRMDVLIVKTNSYYGIKELERYVVGGVGAFKCRVYELALVYKKAKDYGMLKKNDNKELIVFLEKEIKDTSHCEGCNSIKKLIL
jgi:hypothetical protein